MLVFDAKEWNAAKAETEIPVSASHYIEVRVSCTKEVTLYGVCGQKKVPLKGGTSFRFKGQVKGFEHLLLIGTGQTEYGYTYREIDRQDGEPLNNDNPPAPPMPGADQNMLLKLRDMMRSEMRRTRMPVLDPEDMPFANRYHVDDEDYRFEEELYAEHKSRQSSQQNPEASTAPASPPADRKPEASAAEPRPQGDETPSASIAAE